MELTRTIDYVNPTPRDWETDDGKTLHFVEAIFDDGSNASVVCFTKEQVDANIDALKALVGVSTTFVVDDKVKEYQNKKQYKLKSFPGKAAGGGGGGGGSRGGGGMSHSQAGLLAAASFLAPQFADGESPPSVALASIIELSELLTEHLFSRRKSEEATTGEAGGQTDGAAGSGSAPSVAPAPSDSITLPQMARIKQLGATRGLGSAEEIASFLSIGKLGDMTSSDADTLIESWS